MMGQLDLFAGALDEMSSEIASAPPACVYLSDDELSLQAALKNVANGLDVGWQTLRHLIGEGYVQATTTRLIVTDEGRALLAALPELTQGAE